MKGFVVNPKHISTIWNLIEPYVKADFVGNSGEKKTRKKKKVKAKKYTPASYAGNRKYTCSLVIGEGDSATAIIEKIIGSEYSPINSNTHKNPTL
jgi:hypothetical protein